VHDDVDSLVGLDLAHRPSGKLTGREDGQVGQVDELAAATPSPT
jgi:hypothetical protein